MRTEHLAAFVAAGLVSASPLAGQDALNRVGPKTQVRSVEFQFQDKPSLEEDQLRSKIALTGQGSMIGLRRTLGFLPFVPPVGAHPFDPVEMGRDVTRLRHYYQRSGFPKAEVDYQARYQAKSDVAWVTYRITEGPPLMVDSLTFGGRDTALVVPEGLERSWQRFVGNQREGIERAGEDERRALADSTVRWFRAHGYPFAKARVLARIDSAANRADLAVQVDPGGRYRIRRIAVTGTKTIPEHQIVRQLSVHPGQWFDAQALEQARQQLTQMDIVRLASVDVPRDSARDTSVVVMLHMAENPQYLIKGEGGYIASGGLTVQGTWGNRSWLGGLRTLTVAATAQTGIAALEYPAQQYYRLSLSAFQPYVGDRRLSAAGGPFVEYRNDLRDRSWAVGLEGALVWAPAPLRSLSLGYSISHRYVFDYGPGSDLPPEQYLPVLHLADPGTIGTLDQTQNRNLLSLEGSYGRLDHIANPRKGYVIRPRVTTTLPFLSTSEYVLLDLGATAYLPFSRTTGLTMRGGIGRIFPWGNSVDAAAVESPFLSLLELRDAAFMAGGTRDVRGWGSLLLGPKVPQVQLEQQGSSAAVISDRYTPIGGLARLLGSAEFHFPMPVLSEA
ncbi:MAG TPA: FtsQ-type POTRA domain-containing protein, partial [Gemmatimonadales bacterium]|nr:FtsQ-type POTRA domain-containing protein [Gemmatimonadales bacterium]